MHVLFHENPPVAQVVSSPDQHCHLFSGGVQGGPEGCGGGDFAHGQCQPFRHDQRHQPGL